MKRKKIKSRAAFLQLVKIQFEFKVTIFRYMFKSQIFTIK